ncbi:hypothetical protein Tco_1154436 [Tanacetum coccineum]
MKKLKYDIKNWSRQVVNSRHQEQEELMQEINRIELNIEAGHAGFEDKLLRQSKIKRLREIDKQEGIDISQKEKIKWGIEGDENTKIFHGVLNRKRRSLAINGIVVNRKSAHYNTLSLDQNRILEGVISEQEIRESVWAYGSDKSPGPDGFSFAFDKKYWDILKLGILAFVQEFYSTGYIP